MTNMPAPIMAHLVLGYPSLAESLRTAEAYIAAGCAILELQIPFSHPTADGPVITIACQEAVKQGATVSDCLSAIRALRQKYPAQEIMVMSYLNRVFVYGMDRFFQDLTAMGVRHVIVPDLPVDQKDIFSPRRHGDTEITEDQFSPCLRVSVVKNSKLVSLVPVIAANIPDARLEQLIAAGYDFFYLMSDFKITGSTFSLHPRLREIAARIKSAGNQNRIGIGFGIHTPEQIEAVLDVADYAIIGSALITAQQEGRLENYLENILHSTTPAT